MVLCQLFFLPADHGAVGLQLLEDFFWLKRNANSMIPPGTAGETNSLRLKNMMCILLIRYLKFNFYSCELLEILC